MRNSVKRVLQGREQGIKIIEARLIPDAISPSRTFQQWKNGVRDFFFLEDEFSLDDVSSCQFILTHLLFSPIK
jgi:hypothetical protein